MSALVYNLQAIQDITKNKTEFNLPEETTNTINGLIDLLNIDVNVYKQRIQKKEKILKDSHEKWPKREVFKTTVLEKKEGLDEKLDMLRGLMNKITASNYDAKLQDVLECVETILDDDQETFNIILDKFIERYYSVVQNNRFYAGIYAKLFLTILEKFVVLGDYQDHFLNKYTESMSEFVYCDPEEDYDRFCEINQLNERRKASVCFIINLVKEDMYSFSTITDILHSMFAKIDTNKLDRSQMELNEEVIENVFVIMTEAKTLIMKEVSKFTFIEKITEYSKIKSSDNPGFSSRMRFKCMDLVELYKK